MKYFRLTIDATIDEDQYQEMLNQGYTEDQIKTEVRDEWSIGNTPKPISDAEVTSISFLEDNY